MGNMLKANDKSNFLTYNEEILLKEESSMDFKRQAFPVLFNIKVLTFCLHFSGFKSVQAFTKLILMV